MINFPTFLEFSDYHEISNFGNKLNKLFKNITIKWFEVSSEKFNDRFLYGAIYYVNKKPSEKQIKELINNSLEN